VEEALKQNGGLFERTDDWGEYAVTDGHLITGQNPASSGIAAQELLKALDL